MFNNSDRLLKALSLAIEALNTAPRFKVGDTDSYAIASECTKAAQSLIDAVDSARKSSESLPNMCADLEDALKRANYI